MHPTQPRRRPWPAILLLLVTAVALALLAVVLIAPPASAHVGFLVPGPSPPPWPAGAALPAMAVVAAAGLRTARPWPGRRRPGPFDHPDVPGGA
jgi:hypothetical protein